MKKNLIISATIVLLGVLKVTLSSVPNFAPAIAMLLLSSAFISNKRVAFILPMLALFIGDFFLNNTLYRVFYPEVEGIVWYANPLVYLAYAGIFLMSLPIFKKQVNISRTLGTGLAASILFFLVTNFGVWASATSFYPKNFLGLMECYAMGLPFFGSQLLGDAFFIGITFIPMLYAFNGKKALV